MARVTATEAARTFSELLNRVAAGEEIEIVRHGAVVARVGPVKGRLMPAGRFRELVRSLPPADDDFAADLRRIRGEIGPPEDAWPS